MTIPLASMRLNHNGIDMSYARCLFSHALRRRHVARVLSTEHLSDPREDVLQECPRPPSPVFNAARFDGVSDDSLCEDFHAVS